MKKALCSLFIFTVLCLLLAGCTNQDGLGDRKEDTGIVSVSPGFVWNGDSDKAVAVNIAAEENNTRHDASGIKIASNAHSADFPGIYFIWDSKQKDNGYLKVAAYVFAKYESFTLTAKEADIYWDFLITLQEGQQMTEDGCYVFFIPKANGNKNVNMVFISGWKEKNAAQIDEKSDYKLEAKMLGITCTPGSGIRAHFGYNWTMNYYADAEYVVLINGRNVNARLITHTEDGRVDYRMGISVVSLDDYYGLSKGEVLITLLVNNVIEDTVVFKYLFEDSLEDNYIWRPAKVWMENEEPEYKLDAQILKITVQPGTNGRNVFCFDWNMNFYVNAEYAVAINGKDISTTFSLQRSLVEECRVNFKVSASILGMVESLSFAKGEISIALLVKQELKEVIVFVYEFEDAVNNYFFENQSAKFVIKN